MSILSNSNAIADSGADYLIEGSLRFDNNNTQYLHRIPTTTSNRKKWTLSFWYKAGRNPYTQDVVFSARTGNAQTNIWVGQFIRVRSENSSATVIGDVYTSARYYDPTTWMHVVVVFDVANATTADRVKIYVNGRRESLTTNTSFSNTNNTVNVANVEHNIGREAGFNDELDGFLTEFHFLDGVAKDVTDFGVEDSNGIWQPVEYTGTDYGTNGFYLKLNTGEETLFSSYRTDLYNKSFQIQDSSVIEPASGDFCIEFWCRPDTLPSSQENYICKGGSGYNAYAIGRYGAGANDGKLVMYGSSSGSSWDVFNGETFGYVSTDVWHHLAFYRIGNNFYGAVNGHVRFIKTYSGAIWNNGSDLVVGSDGGGGSNADIWVSNFRMVKGNSVYGTSNFAPPSSPLTAISGTGVLTCNSSTLVDNSGNGLTISNTTGTPTMTAFSLGFPECARDHSGNNNQWLPKFFYLQTASYNTQSASYDSPTATDEDYATYPSMFPLQGTPQYNAQESGWSVYCNSNDYGTAGTMAIPKTGKWYWEGRVRNSAFASYQAMGIASVDVFEKNDFFDSGLAGGLNYGSGVYTYAYNGQGDKMTNSSTTAYGSSWGNTNEWIGVAVDMDAGKIWFSKNGVWQNSGDPASGTNPAWSIWTDKEYVPIYHSWSAGNGMRFNFGQYKYYPYNPSKQGFFYAPPAGFKKLNTYNLPDSSIIKAKDHFDVVTYTGTGTDNPISLNFSPDLVWSKSRNNSVSNVLYDSIRGSNDYLLSDSTSAELSTASTSITYDSGGYTWYGNYSASNRSAYTYVNWLWRGSDSTAVSNTDGTVTSTVSANPTAGFSIITWTGDGSSSGSVGTGLSSPLKLGIVKRLDSTSEWQVGGAYVTTPRNFAYHLELNSYSAISGSGPYMMGTQSASNGSTLSLSSASLTSGADYVAYVFAEVEGYSKFGSYISNASTNGTFIYTGFKPAFILIKRTTYSGDNWVIYDSTRDPYNIVDNELYPNTSSSEVSGQDINILSNGFKLKSSNGLINGGTSDYFYVAFAENPLKNARRN